MSEIPTNPSHVTAQADLSLSVGQFSEQTRELPKRMGACQMVAVTRDFHVFASCFTTGFSAVLVSIWHIA
jgi:hypothetical protein